MGDAQLRSIRAAPDEDCGAVFSHPAVLDLHTANENDLGALTFSAMRMLMWVCSRHGTIMQVSEAMTCLEGSV